ncbi:hypothetical protein Tsp_05287, partial [Trichinella spiralis]|uniref:hypothetical protein n=1 Tax=Trichinella spiralis TaxID=6334 RepID=UPI0001EFEC8E
FKEWSKENVKTRTARSRKREGNSFRDIRNGALVCFTCVASNSILKRQTFALNMTNEEKKK